MSEHETADEHTDSDSEDFSREGESSFLAQYAENELGIADDSDRRSDRQPRSEAHDDDDETDADDVDSTRAHHDADPDDDDDDLDDPKARDDDEDAEEEEDEDDAPRTRQLQRPKQEEETEEVELDEDFLERADAAKLPTDFEEVLKTLPAEARRAARGSFKRVLRDVQAGYTRLAQDMTTWRAEKKALAARAAFAEEHTEDFILGKLLENPKLFDAINKRIPPEGDERALRTEKLAIEQARRDLEGKTAERLDTQEQTRAHGEKLERTAKATAERLGIPFKVLSAQVILELQETKAMTPERIVAIAKGLAKELGVKRVERTAGERKSWIQQKVKERQQASRSPSQKARRTKGSDPAPARQRDSDDLRTNIARTVRRIAPEMARD